MARSRDGITHQLVLDFEKTLDSGREQDIHLFLDRNRQILHFIHWDPIVKSKVRLADAFVSDFVVVGLDPYSNDPRSFVTFIEIERANEALFTKSGDPTSFLTHAIRQVQDWQRW